jgi:hypothetical protein
MVRKVVFTLCLLIFVSCRYKVNEFSKRRYKSWVLKAYKDKYIIKDSSNIFNGYYKLVATKTKDNIIIKDIRKNYLVFYPKGKIGRFLDINEEDCDFNSKRSEMGYFGKLNDKYFMRFNEEYPSGYRILESEIVYLDKDSLITFIKESSTSSGFYSKYIKVNKKMK